VPINVEIKARTREPRRVLQRLAEVGAVLQGIDRQVDTYYEARHGRLKLRRGTIEHALIAYERADLHGPKVSRVTLYEPSDSDRLHATLSAALEVLVVVDKQRHIWWAENVKLHVDEVDRLGSFLEVEAIDRHGNLGEAALRRQCGEWLELLAVDHGDLVDRSYSDMLLDQRA
jgi:predicted adenylyl cyclase CyaB